MMKRLHTTDIFTRGIVYDESDYFRGKVEYKAKEVYGKSAEGYVGI